MRRYFRKYTTLTSVRRDDVERKTEARTSGGKLAIWRVWVVDPFTRCTTLSMRRHDMVGPAARLIVRNHQGSRVPVLSIHYSLSNFALEPGTIIRGVRSVFREVLRADDVRDFRQGTVLCSFVK